MIYKKDIENGTAGLGNIQRVDVLPFHQKAY